MSGMKWTKDSIRERFVWKSEHIEEWRRFDRIQFYIAAFALVAVGVFAGYLWQPKPNWPGALIAIEISVFLLFVGSIRMIRFERTSGIPKRIRKETQVRAPSYRETGK